MWWGLGEDLAMLSGRARVGLLLLLEGSFMHESLVGGGEVSRYSCAVSLRHPFFSPVFHVSSQR